VLGVAVPGHTGISFVAGDPLGANLHRFLVFTLITSTGSFDTGRAVTTAVAITVLGPAVLTTLRRAARRAVVVGVVAGVVSSPVETPSPPPAPHPTPTRQKLTPYDADPAEVDAVRR
jgi:energy-coupling factor transport system substrate-specific component